MDPSPALSLVGSVGRPEGNEVIAIYARESLLAYLHRSDDGKTKRTHIHLRLLVGAVPLLVVLHARPLPNEPTRGGVWHPSFICI